MHRVILSKRVPERCAMLVRASFQEWAREAVYSRLTRGRMLYGVSLHLKRRQRSALLGWSEVVGRRADYFNKVRAVTATQKQQKHHGSSQ